MLFGGVRSRTESNTSAKSHTWALRRPGAAVEVSRGRSRRSQEENGDTSRQAERKKKNPEQSDGEKGRMAGEHLVRWPWRLSRYYHVDNIVLILLWFCLFHSKISSIIKLKQAKVGRKIICYLMKGHLKYLSSNFFPCILEIGSRKKKTFNLMNYWKYYN